MVIHAKLASAKRIALLLFFFLLFVLVFIYLFNFFLLFVYLVHRDGCAVLNGFFYAEQFKDVFSEIQNMLNGPGWSRRDHDGIQY